MVNCRGLVAPIIWININFSMTRFFYVNIIISTVERVYLSNVSPLFLFQQLIITYLLFRANYCVSWHATFYTFQVSSPDVHYTPSPKKWSSTHIVYCFYNSIWFSKIENRIIQIFSWHTITGYKNIQIKLVKIEQKIDSLLYSTKK